MKTTLKPPSLVKLTAYFTGEALYVNPDFVTLVRSEPGFVRPTIPGKANPKEPITRIDLIGWDSSVMKNVTQLQVRESVEEAVAKLKTL